MALKAIRHTVNIPGEIFPLLKTRMEEEHYPDLSKYFVGLALFDIYARRRHWLTARIMSEPVWIRDKIIQELVADFDKGELKPGGWFDIRVEELMRERAANPESAAKPKKKEKPEGPGIFLILLAFFTLCFGALAEPAAQPDPAPAIAEFQGLAKKFPKVSTYADGDEYQIRDPKVDVTKSESLIQPLLGTIDCTVIVKVGAGEVKMPMRFEFSWDGKKWTFSKLFNLQNKRDFTELPAGRNMLSNGSLKEFLAPYR